MKEFFLKLFDRDYAIFGASRSSSWPIVRARFLKDNPSCAVCGKTDKKILAVHHKKPFHLFPSLELEFSNLVTLCESPGMHCHITFGHLGSFKSFNSAIDRDIEIWKIKVANRPL